MQIFPEEAYCATLAGTANVLRERRARLLYGLNSSTSNGYLLRLCSDLWLPVQSVAHACARHSHPRSAMRGGVNGDPLTLRLDVIHGGTRGLDGDLAGAGAPPSVVYRPQSEPREAHEPDKGHVV